MDNQEKKQTEIKRKKRTKGLGSIILRKDGSYEARTPVDKVTGRRKTIGYFVSRKEAEKALNNANYEKEHGLYVDPDKMTVEQWFYQWMKEYMIDHIAPKTRMSYESMIKLYVNPVIGKLKLHTVIPTHVQAVLNYAAKQHPTKVKTRIASLQKKLDVKQRNQYNGEAKRAEWQKEIETLSEQFLSLKSLHNLKNMMSSAFQQASDDRRIVYNPVHSTRLAKFERNTKKIRVFTLDEEAAFTEAAIEFDRRKAAFFMFALDVGARLGELLATKFSQIDFGGRKVYVGLQLQRVALTEEEMSKPNWNGKKTKVKEFDKLKGLDRHVDLNLEQIDYLEQLRDIVAKDKQAAGALYDDRGYVFCNELGKPYEARTVIDWFHSIVKKSGIKKANFHALRHTFATRFLEKDGDMKVLQVILGHRTFEMTSDTYAHVLPDRQKSEMDKLRGRRNGFKI